MFAQSTRGKYDRQHIKLFSGILQYATTPEIFELLRSKIVIQSDELKFGTK